MPGPGRPKTKKCASPDCRHLVRQGFRYCGYCGGKIMHALRTSSEYRTDDLSKTGRGGWGYVAQVPGKGNEL